MNKQELTRAVWLDVAAIYKSSTLPRLRAEYDRERKKKKISPAEMYTRCYTIRTKTKNNWMIFLQKAPVLPKYGGPQDVMFGCVVYYFGPKEFTAFKPNPNDMTLFVYKGHVFTRYDSRMKLGLQSPQEKMQHFFAYNTYAEHQVIERRTRKFSIGICRDGVLLGDYHEEVKWVYNRTFVNRDVFKHYQNRAELQVLRELSAWGEKALAGDLPYESVFETANRAHAIFSNG